MAIFTLLSINTQESKDSLLSIYTYRQTEMLPVLVPLEIWQQLIHSLNTDNISGLAWIDEQESKRTK